MTTRSASRRFSPQLPSRSTIVLALASVAAGVAIGLAAGSQYWDDEQSIANVATIRQTTTNIAPGSGVTNDAIQPGTQERKLSPSGVNGFRDFDPDVTFGNAGLTNDASLAAAQAEHDNAIAGVGIVPDPSTVQPSSQERRLSPTGRAGFVDFDPAVRYTSD